MLVENDIIYHFILKQIIMYKPLYTMIHPLLLLAFNRPEHTKRTIESLRIQQPPLVYVFQDGPREDKTTDTVNCRQVRDIINEDINWPCELHTHFAEKNRGCRDAIIFAISEVLKVHESVIVVEDDIVTSPAFYSYMCAALDYYKSRKTVFSICGFSNSPSKFRVPADYDYDVYASPRPFCWGWGTWRDRWNLTDWSFSYYDELIRHPYEQKAFNRGGDDMMPMLIDEREGRSSAWDIQFAFAQFTNHAVSIVPCLSYTVNIGQDGSGTHSGAVDAKFMDNSSLNTNPNPLFLDNLYFDSRIINSLVSIFTRKKRPLWQKAVNFAARKFGLNPPFVIKKRIFVNEDI